MDIIVFKEIIRKKVINIKKPLKRSYTRIYPHYPHL